jgi:replicative DNA helicase
MEQAVGINLSSSMGLNLLEDVDNFISELSKNESKISSGWKWLDNKIGGGFLENGKALYIFIGQTNVGKSIFLGNIAANVAMQGKTALVISLEMSEIMYGMRFASKLTKIPMFELKTDFNNLKDQLTDIKKRNKEAKILIKEFPPSTISPFQVGAYLKKLQQRGVKVDCLVLDYLNLMSSSSGTTMYERIKHISEQLRAISYTYNVPIISASQITRCLHVNSLVDCIDGTKKNIGQISKGDYILGKNGYVEVKHIYPKEIQKCYKIKTKSGKEIICSSKHLFPTNGKICKSIQSGLKIGDKIFVKKTL